MSETKEKKENKIYFGLDVGTMNIVLSRSDSNDIKNMRNVFLKIDPEEINISELSNISYIKDDNDIYIIGQDAFQFANIFAKEISRPMQSGDWRC